jgi:hypothetical protein
LLGCQLRRRVVVGRGHSRKALTSSSPAPFHYAVADKRNPSRDASAPEFCQPQCELRSERPLQTISQTTYHVMKESLLSSLPANNKRKRNAGRRMCPSSALARGARPAGRARLSAFHHGSCRRGLSPVGRSSRPGFLGCGGSASSYQARPNRGAKDSAPLNGRYPRPPVPVQGMHLPDRS